MSVIATPRRGHGWTAFLAAIRLLRFESPAPQISAFAGVRLKF
jgi:hypothetical protein